MAQLSLLDTFSVDKSESQLISTTLFPIPENEHKDIIMFFFKITCHKTVVAAFWNPAQLLECAYNADNDEELRYALISSATYSVVVKNYGYLVVKQRYHFVDFLKRTV